MNDECIKKAPVAKHGIGSRFLAVLLAMVLFLQVVPMEVFAAWDGSGNSGSTSTSPVSGAYLLYSGYGNDMTKHIMGYRFSVYDSDGNKLGHSVDIDCNRYLIETVGNSVYRSGSTTASKKQSHIDLYKAYLRNPSGVSISPLHVVTASHTETYLNARYIYYDETLANYEPSKIGGEGDDVWLTQDKAEEIADTCGATTYSWDTCFIICEPLWTVRLHDYYYYALTMAELAVYQSGSYAAGSWTDIPSSALTSGLYCANVGSYTSAAFGRYLYATGNYTALGTTPVDESAHLAQDKYGTDSVLFQQSTYSSWNTAEDVLKYQIGMAVYTGIAEDPITYTVDFHHHFREEGSAATWEEDTSLASSVTFDAGSKFRVRTYVKSVTGYGVPTIEQDGTGTIGSGTTLTAAAQVTVNSNIRIDYYYDHSKYKITCDMQEGSGGTESFHEYYSVRFQETDTSTTAITSITVPTRDGYTFIGYYTEEDGGGTRVVDNTGLILATNTDFTANTTIYAYWIKPICEITCDKGEGTGGTSTFYEVFGYRFSLSSTGTGSITSIKIPSWAGHTFQGYYTEENGKGDLIVNSSGRIMVANTYFKDDATIYAHWTEAKYTITWVNYDGTVLETDTDVSYGETPSYDGSTPVKSVTGYVSTFIGWSPTISTVTGNATYTAQFSDVGITYQVRYNANGGTGTMSNSTHTYGTSKKLSANLFTRTGYVFKGWATSASSTTVKYTDAQSVRNLASTQDAVVDLYAVWELAAYTIAYEDGDGNTLHTQTYTVTEAITLLGEQTLDGYAFVSWMVESNSGNWNANDTYAASATIEAGKYGDVTLIAQWEASGDTPYKVNHYLMNLDGSTYTLSSTDEKVGENGATLTLADLAKTPDGFTYKEGKIGGSVVTEATILADGSLVIDLYYTRDTAAYQVKHYLMNLDGSTYALDKTENFSGLYGATLTISDYVDTYSGFTFKESKVNGSVATTATIAANGEMVIELYYSRNKYTLALTGLTGISSVSGSGTYYHGQQVTISASEASGFSWAYWSSSYFESNISDQSYILTMPAENIEVFANANPKTYTLTINPNGGNWDGDTDSIVVQVRYGETWTVTPPVRADYSFAKWTISNSDCTLSDTTYTQGVGDCTLTAQWIEKPRSYSYTVNHYLMNLNSTYKLDTTETGEAEIGTSFTGALKSYLGFAQPAAQTITIQEDGNVINYYYTRKEYTLTVEPFGGVWNGSAEAKTFTLMYGEDMTIADPSRSGYSFDYWLISNGACLMDEDTDLYIQGVGNCTLTAIWIPIDVEISAITFRYTDANGVVQTVTDLNSIPIGAVVSVYHTYKNNSGVTVSVNGYHGGSSGKITYEGTTAFSIAAGGSKTVLADSFTVGVGSGSVSGYVYLDGYSFGDASAEHNSANNAMTVNYRGVFDVELVEIYLADTNGNRLDSSRIYEGVEIHIYHVYRNNSAQALSVDYYHNGVKYGSINSMAANSTQAVHVTSVTPSASGSVTFTGAIYRKGMTATTETAEPVLSNNTKSLSATVYGKPYIENYEVSADLRVGTETITSFVVTNPGSLQFVPDMPLVVTMYVYGSDGSLLLTMTQDVVMPANETQLVWFRWEVPDVTGELTIEGKLGDTNYSVFFSECERVRKVVSNEPQFTPDTQYEDSAPSDWVQPAQPSATNGSASWSVWEYANGTFTKVTYGISVTPGTAFITPNSTTAYEEYGNWYMKSGYGFTMEATGATFGALSGCIMPDAADYTDVQWAYATFPEFAYALDYTSTLELVDGKWMLYEFENYGRLHFTPIWYPDTYGTADAYCAQLVQSEIWTPVGVITVSAPTNGIYIEGNMYDDWYISGITRPEWEWTPLLFRPGDRGTNLVQKNLSLHIKLKNKIAST